MSRTTLTLYELDRPRLKVLSSELRAALKADDRQRLADLLELSQSLGATLNSRERAVDLFLLPEQHELAAPLWACLRRVAKKRALTKILESAEPSLEGRLRGLEVLRQSAELARLIDRLLEPRRLPWYLRRSGSVGGWLGPAERRDLAERMGAVRSALVPEVVALLDGLEQCDADAVLHDGL